MPNPYEFLTQEEIAAIEVLIKGGFSVFTSARIRSARKVVPGQASLRKRGRYGLVVACRDLQSRGVSLPVFDPPPMVPFSDDPEIDMNSDDALPNVDDMDRKALIREAIPIPGCPNPSRMKTEDLREVILLNRAGEWIPEKHSTDEA